MKHWFKALDKILRGEATRLQELQHGPIDIPVIGLSTLIALLAIFYGACMGCFAIIAGWGTGSAVGYQQTLASMAKVPMLFFLTLLVTFPSLYVFNALVGSRLNMAAVLRLMLATLAVMLALLASFGPIVAFFAISTTSHPFMQLLNTLVFSIAGILGMVFLLRTMQRLTAAQIFLEASAPTVPPPPLPVQTVASVENTSAVPAPPALPPHLGALDRIQYRVNNSQVVTIFRIWAMVFALIGAQMSWVLRPFIGRPGEAFVFFSPRTSNFFQAIFHITFQLLSRH